METKKLSSCKYFSSTQAYCKGIDLRNEADFNAVPLPRAGSYLLPGGKVICSELTENRQNH